MRSNRVWKRMVATAALAGLGSAAVAFPPYLDRFKETYKVPGGSALAAARCQTCHSNGSGGPRNVFGKAVGAKQSSLGEAQLTAAVLRELEPQDSDGDGVANGAEIAAGTLPGDPKSRPAARPATETPAAPAAGETPEAIPKHSFHPLIVHFPIGLFLFGVVLDALGMRKRNEVMRQAAFWNLAVGALAGVASVPTGFIAALRLGHELVPGTVVFNHLVGGILATILMVVVALWRRKAAPEGAKYLTVLLLAAGLVIAAGHYGGSLVYG
ncbi:MAG: DUF2231 domain-containing protein [Fimbriimonas sp.]